MLTTKFSTRIITSNSLLLKRNFIIVIPQAHVGYQEMLGYSRTQLNPGIHLNLPILHSTRVFPTYEIGAELTNMDAYTKDNVPVTCSGTLFYKLFDVEKAAYEVVDVESSVMSIGKSCARSVIGKLDYDKITQERNLINQELVETVGKSIAMWGVECTRFELQNFGPQNKEVARNLEKQMEAERSRRENATNTEARIRTSEGEKTTAILESEGRRIAAENEAEGLYVAVTKRAEAEAYERELVAKAWKHQIDLITESIKCPEKAAQFLLEMQRLQHLQSIATGPNSKVYFAPQTGIFPTAQGIVDMLPEAKR